MIIDPSVVSPAVYSAPGDDPSPLVSAPGVDEHSVAPRGPSQAPAPKPDEHERRKQRRARFFVPNSSIRLLTVKEAAAELGVAVIWFWQHRHDPDVPKPLRLGDASNPKSPLRYREAELFRYIELKQRETDALRVGNQFPSQAK
jgi:predicted DNA-binding transcriptional regulator AlpA